MGDTQQSTGVAQATNEATEQVSSSTPSIFVNSEPMREDQVQNAVKFLSHPKVRGSPVTYRRSFLEKKGLTKEEIDEAFRRVPDSAPSAHAPNTILDSQVKPSNAQIQAPTYIPQGTAVASTGVIASVGPLARSRFHWYHAIIAVGVLAVSGAGTAVLLKNTIIPRLKSWIRKVVSDEENIDSKPNLVEEVAAAAKAAAKAADDIARASQEMLNSKNDEKRYFQELMNLLEVQVREMKSMGNSIQRLQGSDHRTPASSSKQPYANGKAEFDSRSVPVRSSTPQTYVSPYTAPNSKSYMENGSRQVLPSQGSLDGFNSKVQGNGLFHQTDVDNSVPWYRKTSESTEIQTSQNVQRAWVPPQPPPVSMAEAAEAIRRTKSATKKEQLIDTRPSEAIDELQRITKISETGSAVETNSSAVEINGTKLSSSEIQEEQVKKIEV
jgi:peroxin-14